MLFNIDEVPILFPYDKVYPEQYEYMRDIKRVLDNSDVNGNIQLNHGPNAASNSCILEMPSGTGKTVSLLSITIAYQRYHYKLTGIKKKIIYCSRTMSEIEKTLLELENLIEYRNKMLPPGEPEEDILGLGLTSRKNLCINEEVNSTKSGKLVDEKCRLKTNGELKKTLLDEAESKKTSNSLCEFHENMYQYDVHDYIPKGVYSFEKLINVCKEKKICPYFTSRRMIEQCDIIIYSYHYLLDPKINARVNNMLNLEDTANTIVIFDEAHNIDNVCIESLSIDLNNDILKRGNKSCNLLLKKIDNMRQVDAERLESEYNNLLQGLNSTTTQNATEEDDVVPNPVLSTEILRENVPGNIRKAEHFVRFLKRFIEYLRTRLKVMHVISETPISFLKHCRQLTYIEQKPLQFCVDRLALLLRTLNIQDNNHSAIEDIQCLKDIVSFATLVSTYDTGEFQLIIEPFELENQQNIPNPILHFICLDPSITMKPVFEKFHTIIITSGTISPLDMYPKILKFDPILSKSYKMSLPRQTFLPLVISKSTDQQPLTTRFEIRNDPTIVRNYGDILVRLSQTIPDGLIVFFPSYLHMENLITKWQQQGVLDKIWPHKIILTETPDAQESSVALEIFKKACDNGKGALLFAVARGKVSEGIDFSNHYARAVILIGIPFQYTESKILKARLEYLRNNHLIRENDWLSFDAMRHASQCLGRVIRGKLDYGVMILCDRRFTKRVGQLPAWIRQGMEACNSEQDVDLEVGLNRCKAFLKSMAQKEIKTNTKDLSVWDEKDVKAFQAENEKPLDYSKEGGFLMQ